MQTFMPADTFHGCAMLLDKPRLNKQITECKQLINALTGESAGYANHPATLMWKDNVEALKHYGRVMLTEWRLRGGKGHDKTNFDSTGDYLKPWWWGDESIIYTHQSRLNHKWLVDELRKAIPRGEWPLFRQLYCKHLPKTWNEFCSNHRIELTCLLLSLDMPPQKPFHKFPVPSDLHYIWPTEPGKFKTKRGKHFVEWRPGDEFSVH